MLRKLLYTLIAFFSLSICFADNISVDSLKILVARSKGNAKIDYLNKLAEAIVNTDAEQTKKYADEALILAQNANYDAGISDANHKLGVYEYYRDKYDKALIYYNKSLKIAEAINDKRLMAQAISWIGSLNRVQADYDKAIDNYQTALILAKNSKDFDREAFCLFYIGEVYRVQQDNQNASKYYQQCLVIAKKLNDNNRLAYLYNGIGEVYRFSGKQADAIYNLQFSIQYSEKTNNKNLLAKNYVALGEIYSSKNDYSKALANLDEALKVATEANNNMMLADCYLAIGDVYENQKYYEQAEKHYKQAIEISGKINYKQNYAYALNKFGGINMVQNKYDVAAEYLNRSNKAAMEINDKLLETQNYIRLAQISKLRGNHEKALDYINQALEITNETQDETSEAGVYVELTEIYYTSKDYDLAIKYGEKAIEVAKKNRFFDYTSEASNLLYLTYKDKGDYKKSLDMHIIYTQTLDSIKNEDNTRKILRKQVQLEMDQIKMKEEATRKIEESQRKAEEERSKLYFIILLIGFLLLVVVAFFIYRNSRKQRLANVLLEKQKHQIEEQSNEIKDSINYARHIQQAILPEQSLFDRILPNSFVLYIPKDVVSGDFYFAKQDYDESVFVAAADCTGHGVPGAFMSLISSQKLEQAIKDAVTPGRILENLNREIINTLKQNASDSTSRDGLDIALINVSPSYNEDFIVKYAGANRPLIIIGNDGSINEVKADKVSIGGFTDINYSFTEHELELKAGETIYIYTDGFSDQFGGEKGKKLTSRKFRELLAEMSKLPIREQEAALRKFYLNWTKNNPQIDDVLVIGIKA